MRTFMIRTLVTLLALLVASTRFYSDSLMGAVKNSSGNTLAIIVCACLIFMLAATVAYLSSRMSRVQLTTAGIVVLCSLAVGGSAAAQTMGGSISGTVKDTQGGAIPGVAAVFTNSTTGVTTPVQTNQAGLYRASNLQPGTYNLRVTIAGFSTGIKNGIVLNVGGDLTVDFTLGVAGVDQNITVTGTQAGVDLTTSSLSYDVNSTAMRELPLNGRDFTSLATLNPSVSTLNGEAASAGSMRSGRGKALTISGNRPAANNFLFDGISMNDQSNNTPGSILGVTLGVDAIEQFTLLSDTFPAEYGNASGGILNAVTRSGTNHVHGSAFYFGRNSAIDALNYFDQTSLPNPAFRRNQYGATAGGPIKRDKAFWFADFEAISQLQGLTQLIKVPTLASWSNADSAIQKFQPYYPATTLAQDSTATCQSGVLYACYDTIPIVNTTIGNEDYGLGKVNYKITDRDSFLASYFLDFGDLKAPDTFNNQITDTKTHRMGLAMEYTRTISPSIVNIARAGYSRNLDQGALPSTTQVLNPALNNTGFGYDFVPGKGAGGISVTNLTSLTANPLATDFNKAGYNSYQEYDNLLITKGTHSFKFGANFNRMQYNNIGTNLQGGSFTITSSLSSFLQNGLTTGTHAGKNTASIAGTYGSTLNAYAYPDALNAPVYVGTYNGNLRAFRQNIIGMFAQDDWKALSNLTINYGLRYEFVTLPTDADNRVAILKHLTDSAPTVGGPIALGNPSLKDLSPRIGFSYDPFHNGKTALRAGFGLFDSLDLLNEYDLVLERSFPYNTQESLATSNGINLNGSFPSTGYCLGAQYDTTTGNVDPAFKGGNCTGITPQSKIPSLRTSYIDPSPPRSYIMQWNINIEQQLGAWRVTAGYVGSRGIHQLEVERNINTVMPTVVGSGVTARYFYPAVQKAPTGQTQPLLKLNPNFASINCSATFNIDTYYDALHLSVKHDLSKGFQVMGSFSYGKSIDEASSTASTSSGTGYAYAIGSPQPLMPIINRGRSDFDIKNNAAISVVYDVPTNHFGFKPLSVAANGWEVTTVYRVQSGTPFTVALTGDEPYFNPATPSVSYLGESETDTTGSTVGERPNVVQGCKLTNPGNVSHYINTSCFTYPNQNDSNGGVPGTFLGNESRNAMSGPGYQNADVAFIRNDSFGEHVKGQLRFEFFNVANHPNFSVPAVTSGLGAATVNPATLAITPAGPVSSFNGSIQSTGGNIPRQIQYGYKITF
jgi:Carboxypeptidase regulatory-like domain/TonB dependent receptor/TonB-dependent Receptor Plug Domain